MTIGMKRKIDIPRVFLLIFLFIFAIGQIFPIVWVINSSLLKNNELFTSFLKWPTEPQWQNYITGFKQGNILPYFLNSVVVSGITVLVTLYLALTLAYAFKRMKWKLRGLFFAIILLGMMIPIHTTLIPNFLVFNKIGITDTYFALILPYVAFSLPIGVFLMSGYMESIPKDIEDAAKIDGASTIRIVFSIILPITRPAMASIGILTFLFTWNEYIIAATYLSSDKFKTLPFSVIQFIGEYSSRYNVQFAVMFLNALPVLLIYILLSDKIVKGIMTGGIK